MIYHYDLNKTNYACGLLELGSTYRNIKGLCLYEKYGFREDYSLLSHGCFGVPGTIPMKVDISTFGEISTLHRILTETAEDKKKERYVKPRIGDDYDKICDLRNKEQDVEINKRVNIYNEMIENKYGDDYLKDTEKRNKIIARFKKAKNDLRRKKGKAKTVKKPKKTKARGKTSKRKKTESKSK